MTFENEIYITFSIYQRASIIGGENNDDNSYFNAVTYHYVMMHKESN